MQKDVRLAVKRGIGWMDETCPEWFMNVNLDGLFMDSSDSCVIGQAIGEYNHVIGVAALQAGMALVERDDWAEEHGFQAPLYKKLENGFWQTDFKKMGEYYHLLQEEWEFEIRERQLKETKTIVL